MNVTINKDKKKENKQKKKITLKKIETSKLLLGSIVSLTYLFTIFVCVMCAITFDLSPFAYLIPAVFGLATTAVGFYSWKAKKENQLKIEIEKAKEEQKLRKLYKDDKIKLDLKEDKERNGYGMYGYGGYGYGGYNDYDDRDYDGLG